MILIDSSFWSNVGVSSNDGNAAGNQYDFYNYIDMANGEVVTNQYQFFKESAVDGVYYNTPDEWYEAVGTLYSEPIVDEYSFYQNVTFDGVNPVGNQYEFFKFLTDAVSGIFNLSTALHEWNYQNATDVGTTVTMPDTGSIGGLDMANPDAASEPTLTAEYVSFDGISEFIQDLTSNFRGADTSGVVHILIDYVSDGNNQQFFSVANNGVTNERMGYGLGGGSTIQFFTDIGGSVTILKTTNSISNGLNLLSYYCTGSDNFICINAVKQTSYSIDTVGSNWIKTTIDGGNTYNNIATSSIQRSTPNYYATNIKYIAYTPFVDEASVLVDANKIVQGITTFNPLTIEGLELYLNQDNATTSSWVDQSLNAFNFEQATGTQQPTISTYSVDFDGTDDIQTVMTSQALNDSSGIIFFSGYNTGNLQRIFASSDNATANNWLGIGISANNLYLYVDIGGSVSFNIGTTTVPLGYYYGYIKSTGTAYEFNINGSSETFAGGTDNGDWFADVPNRDSLELGGVLRNSPLYGDVQMNKLIYSNAALSADKIDEINTFMSNPLT